MTRKQAEKYRDRLRVLAARVGETMAGLVQGVRRPMGGESAGGLSNTPIHLGDLGSETFSQEFDTALLENEAFIRNEAVAALERIDRGTYGRCERCGKTIAAERLDALPYARYCTSCASRVESGKAVNLNKGRPGTRSNSALGDVHAAGTPGGGTAVGGLAGTNVGAGEPGGVNLEGAMGSGQFDADVEADEESNAYSGPSGGAVGGTPANKRARGGKRDNRPTGGTGPRTPPRKRKPR